ncbi:DUF4838 domain-containing protein [Paenibacillus sp. FSL K6-1096]|uniref:DUF4838 domain-containing protein n=1 Tax=Paenibacillus sp. FSL K6-1096 TaxID=2921460 RepID=UPI0030EE8689
MYNSEYKGKQVLVAADHGSFASVAAAAQAEQQIDWWDRDSADADICTACYAAVEIAEHFRLALGDPPPLLVNRDEAARIRDCRLVIWVGPPPATASAGAAWQNWLMAREAEWETLPEEGYVITSYVEEAAVHWIIAAKDRLGLLYGAYALLEELGFRWFGLGAAGMHLPPPKQLEPRMIELLDYPRFHTRGVYSEHINDSSTELLDWLGRNRVNFASLDHIRNPHALQKRGIRICMGGHNILYRFLNPHAEYPGSYDDNDSSLTMGIAPAQARPLTYAEAHPEWFGFIDGKRSFNVGEGDREGFGDNFCTTNPDAVRELCRRLTDDLTDGEWKHADYLNFWMLDNGNWCQCSHCRDAGNCSTRMILLVHALRKHLDTAVESGRLKRRINIIFPIYHETLPAPDRPLPEDFDYSSCYPTYFPIERCFLHPLSDPRCTESNQELMETFLPWTTDGDRYYRGEVFMGEYYNVGSFAACPVPLMTIMKQDIPFYYESGIRHFHYMHLTGGQWGTLTLTNYQLYRMLWNPSADTERMLEEYYELYYGSEAERARGFYETLEEAMRNSKYLKHYQYSRGSRHSLTGYLREDAAELFPLQHMQYDARADSSNAGISLTECVQLLSVCRRLLDSALDHARDEVVVARLLEDELRFAYLEDMVHYIYGLVRIHSFAKSGADSRARRAFQRVRRFAESLEHNTIAVSPSTRFRLYDNGLKASWCEQAYLRYKARYE